MDFHEVYHKISYQKWKVGIDYGFKSNSNCLQTRSVSVLAVKYIIEPVKS